MYIHGIYDDVNIYSILWTSDYHILL